MRFGSLSAGIGEPTGIVQTGFKRCSNCHEAKRLSEFHRNKQGKDGRHSWCKSCYNVERRRRAKNESSVERRRRNLLTRYGITPEEVDDILKQQNGCALCGEDPKRPCVDHDHETGEIRGVLCHRCNVIIGGLDDPIFRQKALDYLNGDIA